MHGISGGVLKSQRYQDGTLYEVQVPHGGKFNAGESLLHSVPEGVWHGVRETDDGRLLVSIWVPNN
ncbi:hypothetical protein [Actinomadura sp. WMMB 499]|uniref:hypothetical protein n=1 Tax=Actinomadura sp. WMMB 499 TaxID=1219491 RepID=UPI0012475832|nr:hypothetical protein [Actinomadura sp. WMMB 499]QFG25459.1 hypothetical protein F7P10_34265 [Actinomadura sp. WMMB 499]